MTQQEGQYKGQPFRTFSNGAFINGYSDHYPTYIVVSRTSKLNMIKKLTFAILAALLSLGSFAQTPTGGVKGTVVNRADRTPVAGLS